MATPERALVGLGANVGGDVACAARLADAARAIAALAAVADVVGSSLWTTAPVGPVAGQPAFVNAVASLALRPGATPRGLLAELLAIEAAFGRARDREVPQGPRSIDLDLLLVDSLVLHDPGPPAVVLPHPRMWARAFVLAPLRELVGEGFVVPGRPVTLGERLRAPEIAAQAVVRIRPDTRAGAAGGRYFRGDAPR